MHLTAWTDDGHADNLSSVSQQHQHMAEGNKAGDSTSDNKQSYQLGSMFTQYHRIVNGQECHENL